MAATGVIVYLHAMGMDWDPDGDRERKRETRNRVLLAITITVGLFALMLRTCINHEAEKEHEREMRELSRFQQELQIPTPTPRTPDPVDPPTATAAELDSTTREVCKHLLACGGRTPAEVTAQLDSCVTIQMKSATSPFARDVLTLGNRRVLEACGTMDCAKFPSCYMDTLQALAGASATPKKPITPELRAKFTTLVCAVSAENLGKLPDLRGPNPTPKMKALLALMDQVDDLATVSQLMKEVIAGGCAGN